MVVCRGDGDEGRRMREKGEKLLRYGDGGRENTAGIQLVVC